MKRHLLLASLLMAAGCSITAERYKVPTMTAHSDGNPERIAEYQCRDGYWKARDHRGILWCDSTDNFDRYPLDQDPEQCNGVLVTDTHRPDDCVEE